MMTAQLPIALLQKTVPIYSREFFKQQFKFQPTQSSVKGWAYVRTGVYWCERAFDKGAKGGKVWRVDMDAWREGGKRGAGWDIILEEMGDEEESSESENGEESVHQESGSDEDEGESDGDEDVVVGDDAVGGTPSKKRKRATAKSRPAKTAKATPSRAKARGGIKSKSAAKETPSKQRRKTAHPKSSTSHLPTSILPEDLPTDPYQRALRLLHVGATPESLPCREEEFVDVLSRVEEGVESGGGGCLCGCDGSCRADQ